MSSDDAPPTETQLGPWTHAACLGKLCHVLRDDPMTLQAIATALAAAAAIIQAIAAVIMVNSLKHSARSAKAAADTLEHAQDTSRRQLRAYVDRLDGQFTGFPAKGPARMTFILRNFGQTPATEVTPLLSAAVVPRNGDGQRTFFDMKGATVTPTIIAAGADGVFHAELQRNEWTPHQASLLAGTYVAMFRLRLVYKDIFDVEHTLDIACASRGFYVKPAPANIELVRRDGD